jgi:hypothetical protein
MYMHVFSDNRDTSCVLGDNDGHRAIHYDQIIKRSFGRRARRGKERLGNLGSCFQATGINQELLRSVDGAERGVGHDWPFTIQTYARNALNNFSILVYKAATTSAKRSIGCMNGTGGIQSSTIDIGNGEAVWHKRWFDICHETEQGVGHFIGPSQNKLTQGSFSGKWKTFTAQAPQQPLALQRPLHRPI